MADIIHFAPRPAQYFPIRFGDDEFGFLFMYNVIADQWSYSIFPNGTDGVDQCPLIAGVMMETGRNLIDVLGVDYYLYVEDKPGIENEQNLNWFDRMTKEFGTSPESAGSYLVKISKAEADEYSSAETQAFLAC